MFRYSPAERKEIEEQAEYLIKRGLIIESSSPFGAPVLFVPKPNGTLRMCIDYRGLNKLTRKNSYPMPRVDDLLDQLRGARLFSAIDLMQGYYQIRIKPEDCEKTAFRTPQGLYEFKVLPFGLANAPAVFQTLMNKIFSQQIGKSVLVYLDDILVYSKTPEDHLTHLREVFEILRTQKFFCRLHKCHFNDTEMKYLGHLISSDGVRPDPKKVEKVKEWPRPTTVQEVRAFLGLANYFRKFMQGYSQMVSPLTDLTQTKKAWNWTEKCTEAFERVKYCLTHAPVLRMPDFSKPFEVVADASKYASGGVLLQEGQPIAFDSRKFNKAELNYTVSEQEMLASVRAVQTWRCYLEGSKFTLVTDHCANTFLKTQPTLNRRQARWSEILQPYDFKWEYRPGRTNVADPLSRIPVGKVETMGEPGCASALCAICGPSYDQVAVPRPEATSSSLVRRLVDRYATDAEFQKLLPTQKNWEYRGGLWYRGNQVIVAGCDLQREVVARAHDTPYAGHFGQDRILDLARRFFWWPKMRQDVQEYVRTCDTCLRVKCQRKSPAGLLQPLPVPEQKWQSVSMDFIIELPLTIRGHTGIVVFVDRLTKMVRLAPLRTDFSASDVADLLISQVFRHHGLPTDLITDRDPRFTSAFFRRLAEKWEVKQKMSTSFHPQTDGQTEVMNRTLEDYLRAFTRDGQDRWDEMLTMAEFAMNNAVNSSTGETPFFLNYGRHPVTPNIQEFGSRLAQVNTPREGYEHFATDSPADQIPAVLRYTEHFQKTLEQAKLRLQQAQQRQKAYADRHRRYVEYEEGEQVLLNSHNLKLKHPGSRKLLPRWVGPFTVERRIGPVAYRLALPDSMRTVHPVFHISRLAKYRTDGRCQPPPPLIELEGELEYEVEKILEKRTRKFGRRNRLEYLIQWRGYDHAHDSWEPVNNLLHCRESIQAYEDSRRLMPDVGRRGSKRRQRN